MPEDTLPKEFGAYLDEVAGTGRLLIAAAKAYAAERLAKCDGSGRVLEG